MNVQNTKTYLGIFIGLFSLYAPVASAFSVSIDPTQQADNCGTETHFTISDIPSGYKVYDFSPRGQLPNLGGDDPYWFSQWSTDTDQTGPFGPVMGAAVAPDCASNDIPDPERQDWILNIYGGWTFALISDEDIVSGDCGATAQLDECQSVFAESHIVNISPVSSGGEFSFFDPGDVSASTISGVQETGAKLWPLFAFVGIPTAFTIGAYVVSFIAAI